MRRDLISNRRGFAMTELLVVIGILALLSAILLPAIQASRDAARSQQCLRNLQQLGAALISYHSQQKALPPSVVWGGPPGEPLGRGQRPVGVIDRVALNRVTATEPDRVHANWLILLLPSLDQASLWNSFDPNMPISSDANAAVRTVSLPTLMCPSDVAEYQQQAYVRNRLAGSTNKYARGNYALNIHPGRGCVHELQPDCTDGFHVDAPDLLTKNTKLWGEGAGGVNRSFEFKDFVAGTSHFVVVDEIRAGVHPVDPRGAWALGYVGASLTARHGILSNREDAAGPNNQHPSSDDIVGCESMTSSLGADELLRRKMPCSLQDSSEPEINSQATARSMHPGGVHVLTADGAAHFVADKINLGIWFKLHSRNPGQHFELPF